MAGESVCAALEALAAAYPDWLARRICVADRDRRYGTPMTSWRPPRSEARCDELAIAYARDGYALLEAVYDPSSPPWLRELPTVDVLRWLRRLHSAPPRRGGFPRGLSGRARVAMFRPDNSPRTAAMGAAGRRVAARPVIGRPKPTWTAGTGPDSAGRSSPAALACQPSGGLPGCKVPEPGGGAVTGGLSQRRV